MQILIDSKPLRIRFDKIALLGSEKYDFMYDRIRYLKKVKSGIT